LMSSSLCSSTSCAGYAPCSMAWAVASDFNLIVDARDKSNARLNHRSMSMFRRCLNDLELRESNLFG
jgi:hypothetical protein